MSKDEAQPRVTWIQDLLDRRVPQFVGLYLGASWGVIQFVVWLTERYSLAENLPEIALVTTLSLVPTAALLAYFHGRPGKVVGSRWTRVEKIGIPVNVVATGLLLISVAGSGEADAATETVTLTDETGARVERVLAKQEHRRRLALFGFFNEAGDPDLAWMEDAIFAALGLDLLQDFFFDTYTPLSETFRSKVGESGFANGAGMSVALQRKITRDLHVPYFLRGSFREAGGVYRVRTALYDAERGKLLAENAVEGEDLLALVDLLAVRLKRDLGLPEEHIENAEDLPAAELTTRSAPALEAFARGLRAYLYDRDLEAADELFRQGLAADPSFAVAAYMLSLVCAARNDRDCTLSNLEIAMEHLYKLPERFKFEVKGTYYFHTEEHEKLRRLVEMRIELFPEDIDGYLQLARMYSTRNQWDRALELYRRALELSPEPELYFHALARVHLRRGDVEQARDHMERYVEHFAGDAETYLREGAFLEELNDYRAARASYEKALLLDPGKTGVRVRLGNVERSLGNVELAAERYAEALARAKRPEDKAEVYEQLAILHPVRGRLDEAAGYLEQKWRQQERTLLPRDYALTRLVAAHRYVQTGRVEAAWKVIEDFAPGIEPPFDRLAAISYLRIYNELGEVEKAGRELVEVEAVFEALGDSITGLRPFLLYERGRTREAAGDLAAAIESYRQALAVDTSNQVIHLDLGRVQRKAARYDAALESLERAYSAFAFDPAVTYELGLTYAGLGDDRRAREHLRRAVEMWRDADPGYPPAEEARARLAELEGAA